MIGSMDADSRKAETLTLTLFVLCLLFSASLGAGQLLFKLAANDITQNFGTGGILSFASPYALAALALYGATTVLWIYILTQLPLSTAYPFSLAGAVVVIALAHYCLGEPLSLRQVAGTVTVLAGLAILYA
jgi:drug/metabolite transporter (DMT)-like permease